MSAEIITPMKLIEVALPLDAINAAAGGEKNNPFLKAHPRSIHTWWARQPLTGARAMLFAQLVNDPSWKWRIENPNTTPPSNLVASWASSRKRLFSLIEELVQWKNTTNEKVLDRARREIWKSWTETCDANHAHPLAAELFDPSVLPRFHDPFSGGGAIPLEAHRLGLSTIASDLNPVAVLIEKSMLELPPKFSCKPPVSIRRNKKRVLIEDWPGVSGLVADIRYYAELVQERARKRLASLYPDQVLAASQKERLGISIADEVKVVGCIWARTIPSPNPAFRHVQVPLTTTFVLSKKPGKEAYVEPRISKDGYSFEICYQKPPRKASEGTKSGRGTFQCLLSGSPIDASYIRAEASAGRLGRKLMAVIVESKRQRVFIGPIDEIERIESEACPEWRPDLEFFDGALGFRVGNYGMKNWGQIYTNRQLVTLNTFCELIRALIDEISADAAASGLTNCNIGLEEGGIGSKAYAETVATYLALATSRWADFSNSLCKWNETNQNVYLLFARQAISMTWDYLELYPFSSVGPWIAVIESICESLPTTFSGSVPATVRQANAIANSVVPNSIVSTDPPYFDNIGYADLSDFFYVWLRRTLREVYPELLATIAVPKAEELVATPARHGGKKGAEAFFLDGMTKVMRGIAEKSHPGFPVTIYYAFKQSETDSSKGTSSTGWVTFLEAAFRAGLAVTGTWPMRTNKKGRARANESNALDSAVVLTCRRRRVDAPTVSRREFIRELNFALPSSLGEMTRKYVEDVSPVSPVDLSQAVIGPGMAIFSKYSAVLEADGTPMTVRTALQLINRFLAEDDFDADTQFCLHWFDGHGWDQGVFGEADVLARAKATSVNGLVEAGVLRSGGGKVQLLRPADFSADWNPEKDNRIPIWEVLHQLIRALRKGGETEAGILLSQPSVQSRAEAARQLAYRLYTLCERKGWAEDARAYNELVTSWSAVESNASREPAHKQGELF